MILNKKLLEIYLGNVGEVAGVDSTRTKGQEGMSILAALDVPQYF